MDRLKRTLRNCLIIGTLLLLTLIVLTVVYFKTLPRNVVGAVKTTLPWFCSSGNITVSDKGQYWDVACDKDAPYVGDAMNIDKVTCQMNKPISASLEWSEAYQNLFVPGDKLAFCPDH